MKIGDRMIYSQAQIENYIRIIPLPHPQILKFILIKNEDLFIVGETNAKKKILKSRIRELLFAVKLFNNTNLIKHKLDEDSFLLSKTFLNKYLKTHIPSQQRVFRTLFYKTTKYQFFSKNEKEGFGQGWKRIDEIIPTGNIAYTTLSNAYDIFFIFIDLLKINEKRAWEFYKDKFNYYFNKKRNYRDIIVEQVLENSLFEKLKKLEINEDDFSFLEIDKLQSKIDNYEKQIKNKLEYLNSQRVKLVNKSDKYIYILSEIKEYERIIREINTLRSYTYKNKIIINKNIKDTNRDYHFLTYFSKRFRKEFFENILQFKEYDLSNAAYKILSYELEKGLKSFLLNLSIKNKIKIKDKIIKFINQNDLEFLEKYFLDNYNTTSLEILKNINDKNLIDTFLIIYSNKVKKSAMSILYYSKNRNTIMKESLSYVNIRPNSKKGKALKDKMKVIFLSMLFGKSKIEKLVDYEEWGYFEDFQSYIQQDLKDILILLYPIKKYYEKRFGIKVNKRNFISKIFMSIESQIMNEIKNINIDKQYFRLHDALYIKSNISSDIIKKELNKNIEKFGVKIK
jgi:hypothetical protein